MLIWHRYVVVDEPAPSPHAARPKLASASASATAPAPKPRVETAPIIEAIDEEKTQLAPEPEAARAPEPAPSPEPAVGGAAHRLRRAPPAPERRAPAEAAEARRARSSLPGPSPSREVWNPSEGSEVNQSNEAQLLGDALARLRQAHDPRGALDLLDRYANTYPKGVLAVEARSARIEVLLKLDDRRGALALLDERASFAGRLGAGQLLTRAELRASVGRYADALGDFDRLLAPSATPAPPPGELERALYGRAVTLGHLGRDDRARADLEDYRRRFPTGKHADEVARLLKGAPRP
jgi:hypothetical protein